MTLELNKLYVHNKPVDFRKAIAGLSIIVASCGIELDRREGMLFTNSRRDKLKLYYREAHGDCLWVKHLLCRKYRLGNSKEEFILIDHKYFNWLRNGLDISVFDIELAKDLSYF